MKTFKFFRGETKNLKSPELDVIMEDTAADVNPSPQPPTPVMTGQFEVEFQNLPQIEPFMVNGVSEIIVSSDRNGNISIDDIRFTIMEYESSPIVPSLTGILRQIRENEQTIILRVLNDQRETIQTIEIVGYISQISYGSRSHFAIDDPSMFEIEVTPNRITYM